MSRKQPSFEEWTPQAAYDFVHGQEHDLVTALGHINRLLDKIGFRPGKVLHCEQCGHRRCGKCDDVTWHMAEIKGIVCCCCGQKHSVEVWQSCASRSER